MTKVLEGNLHEFPKEIQIHILSFVWPQCIRCLNYEIEFMSCRCEPCYFLSTQSIISDLHNKYKNSRDDRIPSYTYNYTEESEIFTCYNKVVHYNCAYFTFSNSRDDVYHSFAVNLKPDDIYYVAFRIGGQELYRVHGNIFDALYDLFDIPCVNSNGYTIIPSYLSKTGIETLMFHDIKLEIHTHRKESLTDLEAQCTRHHIPGIWNGERKEIMSYEIGNETLDISKEYNSITRTNSPLLYLLMVGNDETIEININGKTELKLKCSKKYKHVSLFRLAEHLHDFEHTISLYVIKDFKIKIKATEVFTIGTNILIVNSGMAGHSYA